MQHKKYVLHIIPNYIFDSVLIHFFSYAPWFNKCTNYLKYNVHVSTLNLQRALHPKEDVHTDFWLQEFVEIYNYMLQSTRNVLTFNDLPEAQVYSNNNKMVINGMVVEQLKMFRKRKMANFIASNRSLIPFLYLGWKTVCKGVI